MYMCMYMHNMYMHMYMYHEDWAPPCPSLTHSHTLILQLHTHDTALSQHSGQCTMDDGKV